MKKVMNSILAISIMFVYLSYRYYKDFIVPKTSEKLVTYSSCIDGDTAVLIVDGNKESVRFLAIDAPESVDPYGKEASDYTCNLLENANEIKVEIEEKSQKDKYNRLLAWVWIDSELIQLMLVENGLSKVKYLYNDYKYTDLLIDAQKEAKSKKIGIWNK